MTDYKSIDDYRVERVAQLQTLRAELAKAKAENRILSEPDGARVVAIGGELLTGSEIYQRCLEEVKVRAALESKLAKAKAEVVRVREAVRAYGLLLDAGMDDGASFDELFGQFTQEQEATDEA